MLPNFLIVGAPRSATTFLSNCLSEHPDIYLASIRKGTPGDIHFFNVCTEIVYDKNFEKGLEWYQELFAGVTNETAIGEKTAHYLCDPKAPELISQYLPHVRMIAILRNPIERAYSEYWYHFGEIPTNMTFLEACYSAKTKRLLLLEAGFYYGQIIRYLNYFDRSQFCFLLYDDLQIDPLGVIRHVFRFLNVDDAIVPSQYDRRVNIAGTQKRPSYYLRFLGGYVKQRFPDLFQFAKQLPITSLIQQKIYSDSKTNSKTPRYPDMSVEERLELSSIYYESDSKLATFLDRDLVGLWHDETSYRSPAGS